ILPNSVDSWCRRCTDMKTMLATFTLILASTFLAAGILGGQQQPNAAASAGPAPPLWAFPVAPAAPRGAGGGGGRGGGGAAAAPDASPKSVPNSTVKLTPQQVRDTTNIPDWHPDGHPALPNIVQHGRQGVVACGYCHLPNGQGRPENSSV